MTCSQQPELRLSLNYTDGQRNMWSYYAPNGRRYRQILVEKQCLCGSRLNWTNWEDVTISPERLMGLEWRLTGVKCRAFSGCVQIPTGLAAQMEEIWHKVWKKCRGNSGEEWLLRRTCTFEGIGRIAMWDYVWSLVWMVWADPEVWQNVADRVQEEGDRDKGISPQLRMILPNGLGGWVDADMGYQSSKYRKNPSRGWGDMTPKKAKLRHNRG